ncbi:MAG: TnsA-like heteromeric transposase endonuclease subunit [Nocardioides sp.]
MGQSIDTAHPRPSDVGAVVSWTLRMPTGPRVWDWAADGPPDPRSILSIRAPRSTEKSRHIPVQAYSVTLAGEIRVESGLEHDLVRELDRDSSVTWMVSQPVRLRLVTSTGRHRVHTPDLLVVDRHEAVVIWDVRPSTKQDERFAESCKLTADACAEVGWTHRIYSGSPPVRRYNIRWLTAYRMLMPWYANALTDLITICSTPGATIDAVLRADRGAGHLVSAMWHYAWTGRLQVDLDQPLGRTSAICVSTDSNE